jgi:hypothetical protein
MSIQRFGSPSWLQEFGDGPHACFVCGEPFADREDVGHWMGAAGPKAYPDLSAMDDPKGVLVFDELAKNEGGLTSPLDIFFHQRCIPRFARRLLADFELLQDEVTPLLETLRGDGTGAAS